MTLFTLGRRSLGRRKGRTALLIVAVAAAFLLFGLLSAMKRNFTESDSLAAERRLVVSNRVGFTQPIPIGYVDQIRSLPAVAAVTHRTLLGGYFRERRNLFVIAATEPASFLEIYPEYLVTPAERSAFTSDRNSVLVGESLATRFGWKTGDTIPLRSTPGLQGQGQISGSYRVAGLFRATDRSTGTNLVLMHYDAFNSAREADRDSVGNILVLARDRSGNDALAKRIDDRFANSPFRTKTATEQEFGRQLVAQLGNVTLIVATVSAAGFFAILLILASATATSVRERQRDLAVLRTLGFPPSRIARMIIGETLAVTAVGGALGLYLASAVTNVLRPLQNGIFARMEITSSTAALAILIMLAFAILASLAPVLQILRMPVTRALARRAA